MPPQLCADVLSCLRSAFVPPASCAFLSGATLVAARQTACILTTAKLLFVNFAHAGFRTDLRGARACDRWSGHLAAAPVPRLVGCRSPCSLQAGEPCRDLHKDTGHRRLSSTPRTLARPCSGPEQASAP